MYPASRESAAFGGKAMMGYARLVPNNWTGHEGHFFVPGLPNAVALFRHQLRASKLGVVWVKLLLLLWLPKVKRALSGKHRPDDTRELVRECHDNLVAMYPFRFHSVYPDAEVVLRSVEMQHARACAVNKQLAQIWIATLADPEEALLSSC